jgi:hypothetical protein
MPRKRYAARVGVGWRRETTGRVSISGNGAGAAVRHPGSGTTRAFVMIALRSEAMYR